MRARLTACTDKAFFYATMPLVHIELSSAGATNDNKVLFQAPRIAHSRRVIQGIPSGHLVKRAIRVLRFASKRGLFQATPQKVPPDEAQWLP